ncbi:MAG: malto-oligosyltrehalose synthase [Dehalococcoidia bacterium]
MTGAPSRRSRVPRATYRLQLHAGFGFDAVRDQAAYLARLGISDVYLSPILQAAPGSTHGYDVVDPTSLSAELGGEPAFERMIEELRRLGLGLVVDIVPNHMGIAHGANPWWEDVLRLGQASPHAPVFDIDWDLPDPDLRGRVLLAILGDHLNAVLARGELTLEGASSAIEARYFDRRMPLAPGSVEAVLGATPDLQAWNAQRTSPAGIEAWHRLLEAQHYRLEFWREGKPRINYRRFFEIDTLAGVRQEDPEVFERTHALLLRLVGEGAITGLRIDHIDGLRDPAAYLDRLRAAAGDETYIVVEKILAPHEALPADWATDGTTGYDFLNELNGTFVAADHESEVLTTYRGFTGREEPYSAVAYASRRAVIEGPLAGRFEVTLARLRGAARAAVAEIDAEDFDEAARAVVASMPVYRTYHTPTALGPDAPPVIEAAIEAARAQAHLDPRAVEAVRSLFQAPPVGEARTQVLALQQLMPAVAAKGLEDSAFYRYFPLASLNAVGGEPDRFGVSVEEFHADNEARRRDWPMSMTVTATHDHKRGVDARARIDAISELPEEWAAALERWSEMNDAPASGVARLDEYLLYQTLLGTWPPEAGPDDIEDDFADRIEAYAIKALREGGERSRWIGPDEDYEAALTAFIRRVLDPATSRAFVGDFAGFARRTARLGAINSLAMVVLRIAAPGVPDTYQGGERWDLSLVDPDNRRPVDFEARHAFLDEMSSAEPRALIEDWPGGEVKQFVLARMLEARRALDPLFIEGDYVPLEARGARAEHVIAFARRLQDRVAIAVAPRFVASMTPATTGGPLWAPDWGDTTLDLPPDIEAARLHDAITGVEVSPSGAALPLAEVLGSFPVALLEAT